MLTSAEVPCQKTMNKFWNLEIFKSSLSRFFFTKPFSFHCDLTEWGMIQDVTRSVQDSCTLKNNAKRSHHNFEKKSFSNDDQNE